MSHAGTRDAGVGEWVAIREIVQKLTNVAIKKNEEILTVELKEDEKERRSSK